MTNHELFGSDWDDELLFDELGHHLSRKYPAILEEDDRFMNWLVRDLRLRRPVPGDWDANRIRRVRQRILERALSERLGVRYGGRTPQARDVAPAAVHGVLDDAIKARCAPWIALSAAAGEGRDLWDEVCDRWIELPPGIEGGRYVALGVAGDSMIPMLHPGDTILVRLGPSIARDTVVVARRGDDGYVVKRAGCVSRRAVELLSLNPAYHPLRVSRDERSILGTVVMRWSAHESGVVPAHRQVSD